MHHVAVLDIGKSNAKLALVDLRSMQEIAVLTCQNIVKPGPPWPHYDLDGLWSFFCAGFRDLSRDVRIDAIIPATHGAAGTLIGKEGAAVPMIDYEFHGPDDFAAEYDLLRPSFGRTGSPRLPAGLNLGAQVHYVARARPDLWDKTAHFVTYPQFWGYRLTGKLACDVCSLGAHSDLWLPAEQRHSPLVATLGLAPKIAPTRMPNEILGAVTTMAAAETGLAPGTPVAVGIHDSNASLYPYLRSRKAPFAVVSTGTWVITMAIGGRVAGPGDLRPERDTLLNVDAMGRVVPSARFMGGREFSELGGDWRGPVSRNDREEVLRLGLMQMPSAVAGAGPYGQLAPRWLGGAATPPQRHVALSWYLALMTAESLADTGAAGPAIVEGPFAGNEEYLSMLACLWPCGVESASGRTGTALGAALLVSGAAGSRKSASVHVPLPDLAGAMHNYAELWRRKVADHQRTSGLT